MSPSQLLEAARDTPSYPYAALLDHLWQGSRRRLSNCNSTGKEEGDTKRAPHEILSRLHDKRQHTLRQRQTSSTERYERSQVILWQAQAATAREPIHNMQHCMAHARYAPCPPHRSRPILRSGQRRDGIRDTIFSRSEVPDDIRLQPRAMQDRVAVRREQRRSGNAQCMQPLI